MASRLSSSIRAKAVDRLEAIDNDVPAPVITLSLMERIRSREVESFGDKLLSALRNEFGGHAITKE